MRQASVEVNDTLPNADLYRTMSILTRLDERLRADIRRGRLACTYFCMSGQEAVAAGVAAALRPDDFLVATYRGLHLQVAKGMPIRQVVGEMIGSSTGAAGGKGGGMHVASPEHGVMFTTGIVGAGMPVAVGLGLAAQMGESQQVVLVSFGDGAANTGAFHESLNLAAVWRLPVIFLCENNSIAEMTPFTETTRIARVSDRADAYGIGALDVDGTDPVAVAQVITAAAEDARAGRGPVLVEAHTVRPFGHHAVDSTDYLDPALLEQVRSHPATATYRARLTAEGLLSEAALSEIDQEAAALVTAEIEAAVGSPLEQAAAGTGVYADDSKGPR